MKDITYWCYTYLIAKSIVISTKWIKSPKLRPPQTQLRGGVVKKPADVSTDLQKEISMKSDTCLKNECCSTNVRVGKIFDYQH